MDKLSLVKDIIGSFNSASEAQQKQILDQIIATGEVSRDDVMTIYNNITSNINIPYLENLPYNVFLNVIINGDITGKDLINLCNSSPMINKQCNKPFKLENSDQVVPQYLFMLLLKKEDINYQQIHQRRPNLSPRDVYFYYTVGDGVSYRCLRNKIYHIADIFSNAGYTPNSLFELLYADGDNNLGFLRWIVQRQDSFEYKRFDWIIGIVYESFEEFEDLLLEKGGLYDIDKMSDELRLTPEELLINSYDEELLNPDRMTSFEELFPETEFTLENYISIVRNYPEYYRQYLLIIPDISNLGILFQKLEKSVNNINQSVEYMTDFDDSKLLDDEDIKYLIKLHLRVLSGELKINTKFNADDLI